MNVLPTFYQADSKGMAESNPGRSGDDEKEPLIFLDGEKSGRVKVSSVLNRDVKQFGKKFMFDGNKETCWNSDQGSTQSILVELPNAAKLCYVELSFQGGFASLECILLGGNSIASMTEIQKLFPMDDNSQQKLLIESCDMNRYYKLLFTNSTDFYGRIVVYHLQFYGYFSEKVGEKIQN